MSYIAQTFKILKLMQKEMCLFHSGNGLGSPCFQASITAQMGELCGRCAQTANGD